MTKTDAKAAPKPPKRAQSAFFLFRGDQYAPILAEHPDFKVTQITKVIGERWSALAQAEKDQYQKRYLEAKAKSDQEMKDYIAKYGKPAKRQKKVKKEKKVKADKKHKKDRKVHKAGKRSASKAK